MQHIRSGKGGTMIYDQDDWALGLAVGATFSNSPIGKTKGAAALTGIDGFRNPGFIQPGVYPSTATNNSELAGAVVAAQASGNDTFFGVDIGGKVQKYTISTSTLSTSFHTIAGTLPHGQDCVIYKHKNGGATTYATSTFYTYYNNAGWNLGVYLTNTGSSFVDDYISNASYLNAGTGDTTDPIQFDTTNPIPHPMAVGADDLLYIGSGRYLHSYDGTDTATNYGKFTSKVLTLPLGFQIIGLLRNDDTLLIAGNYAAGSGSAVVYVWDYNELDPTKIIPANDQFIYSIFLWRGVPCVITGGANSLRGTNRVKQLVGNSAVKLTDIGSLTPPLNRAVDGTTSTLFVNCAGNIVTVGNSLSDTGFEVNNITSTNDGISTGTSGWVRLLSTNVLLASSDDGSGGSKKFVKFDSAGYVTGSYRAMFFEPPFPVGWKGRVTSVVVVYKNTVTAEGSKNHIISLWKDYTNSDNIIVTNTSLASPLTKKYVVKSDGTNLPDFENLALRMTWQNGSASYSDSFVVSKVVIGYEDIELPANS